MNFATPMHWIMDVAPDKSERPPPARGVVTPTAYSPSQSPAISAKYYSDVDEKRKRAETLPISQDRNANHPASGPRSASGIRIASSPFQVNFSISMCEKSMRFGGSLAMYERDEPTPDENGLKDGKYKD